MPSSDTHSPLRFSDLIHPVVAGLISVIVNYGGTFILVFPVSYTHLTLPTILLV